MHLPIAGRRRRTRRALLAAALPAVLAAVALPSAAHADGFVGVGGGGDLFYNDTSSVRNDLIVRMDGNEISIRDKTGRLTAAPQCRVFNLSEAVCPATAPTVNINTFGGDDSVEYRLPQPGFVSLGEGVDTLIAGTREAAGRTIQPMGYSGGSGHDTVTYDLADRRVSLTPEDGLSNDSRAGDADNVGADFETIIGSSFDDTLFGTPSSDVMIGGAGRDLLAGGFGSDVFVTNSNDGADDYHGGPGSDSIDYFGRTQPLLVSLNNVADDGERGEGDQVRSNVENIFGGSAGDVLESLGAFSRLDGRGGDDFLFGGPGPDTLIGGTGIDNLNAGSGNDVVDARDGQLDTINCGDAIDIDTLLRDEIERRLSGCESVQVGTLRLAPKAVRAEAGKVARLQLRWRHPQGWRKLRKVELRLTQDGMPVGEVTIDSRGKRIAADGAVALVRKATRLTTRGKQVSARLAIRPDASLAGQTLQVEVEATDIRGRRQLERDAGTILVAK